MIVRCRSPSGADTPADPLNARSGSDNAAAKRLVMHIFPREHGLSHVFTPPPDLPPWELAALPQPARQSRDREYEITVRDASCATS